MHKEIAITNQTHIITQHSQTAEDSWVSPRDAVVQTEEKYDNQKTKKVIRIQKQKTINLISKKFTSHTEI